MFDFGSIYIPSSDISRKDAHIMDILPKYPKCVGAFMHELCF